LYDLEMGTVEGDVERDFYTNIFPNPKLTDSLKRTDRLSMAKNIVLEIGSNFKVSNPVPDILYSISPATSPTSLYRD
jgi:hypothetical protein